MSRQLQTENYSLRQQLESLLQEARRNEEKMRRFDALERRLISAGSLPELIQLLLTEYKSAFNVEHVSLNLVDHAEESTKILENELRNDSAFHGLTLLRTSDSLKYLYKGAMKPHLGRYSARHHQALFNSQDGRIESVALLPLIRRGELIGSLNLGSSNPERYVNGCGTDFLERLSEIIAVCLESALANERLKMTGLTDGLTGTHNRRYFEQRLLDEINQSVRHQYPLACMFLDIDKFKRINDTFGHQAGDAVLAKVASVIQSQLRAGDTICRYGGEEFVVLLPRTECKYSVETAERIRTSIEAAHFQARSGHVIDVTISIGLSMLELNRTAKVQHVLLAEKLVAQADKALYEAKHTGRNKVVWDQEISKTSDSGTKLSGKIRKQLSEFQNLITPTLKRLAQGNSVKMKPLQISNQAD